MRWQSIRLLTHVVHSILENQESDWFTHTLFQNSHQWLQTQSRRRLYLPVCVSYQWYFKILLGRGWVCSWSPLLLLQRNQHLHKLVQRPSSRLQHHFQHHSRPRNNQQCLWWFWLLLRLLRDGDESDSIRLQQGDKGGVIRVEKNWISKILNDDNNLCELLALLNHTETAFQQLCSYVTHKDVDVCRLLSIERTGIERN